MVTSKNLSILLQFEQLGESLDKQDGNATS